MQIDWMPDGRPDAAHNIANHTQHVLSAMNAARDAKTVKQLFDQWMIFARQHRVCKPICEQMINKRRWLLGEFDKPKAARPDITKRMTGERDE